LILDKIGKGAKGTVYKVRNKQNNKICAMKEITLPESQKMRDIIVREVENMKRLPAHPNLIQCNKSFIEKDAMYIIMDFMEGGDLSKVFSKTNRLAY
jgi:serine/threonine protein kinase